MIHYKCINYSYTNISKSKSNPKKKWEIINFAVSTPRVNSSLTKINTENFVNDNPSKIADCFNQFFVKMGHSLPNNVNKLPHVDYTT